MLKNMYCIKKVGAKKSFKDKIQKVLEIINKINYFFERIFYCKRMRFCKSNFKYSFVMMAKKAEKTAKNF